MVRKILQGKACIKIDQENGKRKYEAHSDHRVCAMLGAATFDTMLRSLRLKFLQSMLADPKHHEFFWTAILGKYEFEDEASGSPWSDQVSLDILQLAQFDGVQNLCQKYLGMNIRCSKVKHLGFL